MNSLSPKWYLGALSFTIVCAAYAQYLWQYNFQDLPLLKDQPPGISLQLIGFISAVILWFFAPWHVNVNKRLLSFVSLLILTWLVVIVTSILHGDVFPHSVWTYAPILILLVLKAPNLDQCRFAFLFTGWLIVVILVGTRLMEITGIIDIAYIDEGLIGFEQKNYWLPLGGSLGPEYRWPGPMGHNAMTGVMGAYLVAMGAILRKFSGLVFVIVGVLTLLLTSSRVAFVAAVIGLAVVLLLGNNRISMKVRWRIRALVVGIIAILAAAVALIASPNLTGRTNYWSAFYDLWLESPWVGVGNSGRVLADPLISQTNAHNIFLDVLTLYGVIPLLTMSAALVLVFLASAIAARSNQILPLAIVTVFLVVGLTQSDHGWISPSEPWWLLVLAAFMASQVVNPAEMTSENVSEPTSL
jgi:O-antigen ligase